MNTATVDVLVVDDEEDVRASVADVLRSAGFTVEEAEDGLVALALLERLTVGAMVLDLSMPRCDGVEVIDRLASPPPILIVSARQVSDVDRIRVEPKITAYLKKPVSPARLIEQVRAAIDRGGPHEAGRRTPD